MELRGAQDRLVTEFSGIYSPETITEALRQAVSTMADAPVQAMVPVLVERVARDRLQAGAQVEGSIVKEVPEVLFVCVHNAGRSQMAAALLDHRSHGRVHVRSAGARPPTRSIPPSLQ
jgi:arsenate reductase